VGGFRHPPNVDAVEWLCSEIIPLVAKESPEISFFIIGSNPPNSLYRFNSAKITIVGYVDDEALANFYKRTRLVIAPLRYGAGVKGKVLEAMYHGVPVLTTSVGTEGMPSGCPAITADTPEDFTTQLVQLYFDYPRLEELSRHGQAYIGEYFSFARAKQVIQALFPR